jgi:H+/gluconate symporter-like permease
LDTIAQYYPLAVLLGAFALLTVLAMRGKSIYIVAPLCAGLALSLSGLDPLTGLTGQFMQGFADFLRDFFLIFALGAAFGKLMEQSGAAVAIARAIVRRLGPRWACLAVVLSCAVLTYGGVSLFVVGFSIYPLAIQLFRQADLPRRFIPAAIAFGSITFTMTTAGSPEIQNLIPIKYLVAADGQPLTDARAGWPASLIVAAVMFGLGQWYLQWELRLAARRGERFEPRPSDPPEQASAGATADAAPIGSSIAQSSEPGLAAAFLPLATTLLTLNVLPWIVPHLTGWAAAVVAPESRVLVMIGRFVAAFPRDNGLATLAVFVGVVTGLATLHRHLTAAWTALGEGFVNGLLAIGSTCSVVGFGKALQALPAFGDVKDWVVSMPGDPLIGAAAAVAVISCLAGSASGGQGLAWPIIKPIFVDQLGVPPRALHRVVAIASGTLDTLPANGYLVMLIRNICGETHRSAYWPICVTCTLLPMLGVALAIALFKLFPAWALM